MTPEIIKTLIETHLPDSQAFVTGDGHHFQATVISKHFSTLSKVQQQQRVYQALSDEITSGHIHALSLKTLTPEDGSHHQEK